MKKTLIQLATIIMLMLCGITVANAYSIPQEYRPFNEPFDVSSEIEEGDGARSATILVLQVIAGGLLYFAAPIAVIMIIVSAIRLTIMGAESEQYEQAKKGFMWTIVGLILIILSYSGVKAIIAFIISAAEATGQLGTSG